MICQVVVHLYADDTTLQKSGDNLKQLEQEINAELVVIRNWFLDNMLSLHPKKTKFMVFQTRKSRGDTSTTMEPKIENTVLQQCGVNHEEKAIKFLGLMVDENLNWGEHVAYTETKLRKIIYSINQVKKIFPIGLCIQLFKSLLMPHIDYGLLVYGNSSKIGPITKLKKLSLIHI